MSTLSGFSLTEVLVSLAIVTSTSMAMFNQHAYLVQLIQQIQHRQSQLLQQANAFESGATDATVND